MAKQSSIKQLAKQLASIALRLSAKYGDAASQTVVYGALLGRLRPNIPVDKLLENTVAPQDLAVIVEEVSHFALDHLQAQYSAQGKDPAVYFFEEFLRAYSASDSRKRGVHYSPPEVVSYIVRGVDALLRDKLDSSLDDALVLDPCCGIGTFPCYIETKTLWRPQMIGLELDPTACKLASCLLKRCNVVQGNSLEEIELPLDGKPLVVIGNPPYSGHSANSGSIAGLIADYKTGLSERNPKWLQDDYVKFMRMAQRRVDQAGQGAVAFITNHSFIFNPTFQAMRASLMHSFDEIYILDLHGNAKMIETTNGEPDENVFPIQMGVAVSFMVKMSSEPSCKVYYSQLRGSREHKLKALAKMKTSETPWTPIGATAPHFSFTVRDTDLQNEFCSFPSISELFNSSSVGFVTSRDAFAVDFGREALLQRIAALRDGSVDDDILRNEMGAGDLDLDRARRELRNDANWQEKAIEVLYRPFDRRWAYYSRAIMERPRLPFMDNMIQDNIALAVGRAGHATGSDTWDVVFCTDKPADLNLFRRGGALLLPRYVYEDGTCRSNIKLDSVDHDQLFAYIYALLYSTAYRARYADLLSIDFPHIPLSQDKTLFEELAKLGTELIEIHLMRNKTIEPPAKPDVSLTIGGYKIPQKLVADRSKRGANNQEESVLRYIRGAVPATLALQKKIDMAVLSSPPWKSHIQL